MTHAQWYITKKAPNSATKNNRFQKNQNMKKIFYTAAVAAIALGMTACGGKKEETANAESAEMAVNNDSADENIPASVNVTVEDGTFEGGDMAEYVAIVPGEYTFNYSDGRATIELKAKGSTAGRQTDLKQLKICDL